MRNRKRKWVKEELENCVFFIKDPLEYKGKWEKAFKKVQPMHLELGCGKGTFISQMAKNHPEINYLAIDMINDMLGLAKRNIEKVFGESKIDNVLLTAWDVERLLQIFDGEKFGRLYINFCNPWPKARHHKKRLTHPKQLEFYKQILSPNADVYFKTDDMDLYKFSLRYFEESGFTVVEKTEDLHQFPIFAENIVTEHEKMFIQQGIPIKAIIANLDNFVG